MHRQLCWFVSKLGVSVAGALNVFLKIIVDLHSNDQT
jgi:hypothetical protein